MRVYLLIMLAFTFSGCASTTYDVTSQEEREAMKTVVEAISGDEVTDKEMRKLSKEIEKDEEAKSAVKSLTNALSGEKRIIKYCPEDGKRYAAHLEYCPGTKIPLKIVE